MMKLTRILLITSTITAALAISACENNNNGFKNPQQTDLTTVDHQATTTATAGENFLQKNKTAKGVKTTASGLQYKINHEGHGRHPKANDVVTVTYEGKLVDGTVFDSTKQHGGQPATFPLNQVIAGWTEGLQLMKEGSDYTFYIPANLAYGDQDVGDGIIPPNSTLIFNVKLLKIGK